MLPLLPFLFLFFFFFHPLPPANSLNSEGSALLSLKQSLTDPEGFLSNWNYSDSNPCSWNGVTCNFLKVISISIPKSKLHGSLPSSLGSLSQLRHVNFRSNNLFGSIPTELFQALKLQSLVLYDNSFSGYVPNEIGNLRYIQTLDLSQNFFNGSFPNAIFSCKRLQFLDLSENNFTGSLPNNGFGTNFLSLQLLDLSFNNFIGSIPSDLGNLSSLQGTVDLSHNNFSGSIPPSLGNLPEKVYIDLTFNNLSGPIPQNGALVNRGPTAFLGNPSLCGPPLKNPCSSEETHANNSSTSSSSSSSLPSIPDNDNIPHSENHKGKGLGKISVIAIVVGDLVGIFLLGLLFSFCYSRICGSSDQVKDENVGIEKEEKGKKNCLFFRKDESETLSDNLEHINHNDNDNNNKLVALDSQVGFDLDELLKASAFVLGKSGIGIVYKVVFEDGLTLAVRRLEEGGSQRLKEFQNEVETIGKMRHPNVVTLRAYYWSIDEKLLIYDFVPNGSLASAIHGKAGLVTFTPLSWSMRLKIMKGIAKGLVYLHEFSPKKFVHGDLKPSNILLGQNMEPCISDFGLGRLANIAGLGRPMTVQSNRVAAEKPHEKHKRASSSSEVGASTTTISSTLGNGYRAPESLKVMKPSQKWDVYSYGVILLEMITGRLPLVQVNNFEMDLVQWIQFSIEEKKPFKDVLDPYLAQDADREDEIVSVLKMAMACVHRSPEKRPAMRHVLEGLHRLSVSYD